MRDALYQELLGAVGRRLTEAADGDVSALFDEFAAGEADQLESMLDRDDTPAAAALARFRWLRHSATERATDRADLDSAIRHAAKVPPTSRKDIPAALRLLATIDPEASGEPGEWYGHAVELLNDDHGPDDLDETIGVLAVVHHMAAGDLRTRALVALTIAHLRRADASPKLSDLDEAIAVATQAGASLPVDHPQRWFLLTDLALVLRRRYGAVGDPGDLYKAITAGRAALETHPSNAPAQSGLAIALRTRHGLTGDPADLAGAVEHGRSAADLFAADDPERAVCVVHLASALLTRAQETGSAADLDEAVECARTAESMPGERYRAGALKVLADVLAERSSRDPRPADLGELVQTLRKLSARDTADEHRARLARALTSRYLLTQDGSDLDETVQIRRELADRAAGLERRGHALVLATALHLRYEVTGSTEDLVEGIMCLARAVEKSPGAEQPRLTTLLGRLRDYARTGDAGILLDPAVPPEIEQAVNLKEPSPDLEACVLAGWILWLRVLHAGDQAEDDAVRAAEVLYPVYLAVPDAVPVPVSDHFRDTESAAGPGTGTRDEELRHNASGLRLLEGYLDTGNPAALDDAVGRLRMAVDASTSDENRAAANNNLALALAQLSLLRDDRDVTAEAVSTARRSVELSSPDAHYLPGRLSILCAALSRLGVQDADPDLIREAKETGERSVAITPADHPSRGAHQANLGAALLAEYQLGRDPDRLRDAIGRHRDALPSLPPGHPHHVAARLSFVAALHDSATATETAEPLREAERVLHEAMTCARGWHRQMVLASLARTQYVLYRRTEDRSALADAVATARELVAATSPTDPGFLRRSVNLAELCSQLFALTDDETLLDEGITLARGTRSHPGQDDLKLHGARVLTMLLRWKAEDTGDASFLEEANRVSQEAVRLTPRQAEHLADHAHVLLRLHRTTGRLGALRSSIEAGLEALEHTASDDPRREERGHRAVDALRSLYELTGERDALERGMALAKAELERDPAPDSTWRLALASMLSLSPDGLEEATELLQGFLTAIPSDHRERSRATSGLGLIFTNRYLRAGPLVFLQEAIALFRADGPQASPATRNSLAEALSMLYHRTGDPAALAEAVDVGRDLVSSTSVDLPYRSLYLGNLAGYLLHLWRLTGDGQLVAEGLAIGRAAVVAAGGDLAHRADNLARLSVSLLAAGREADRPDLVAEAVDAARQAVGFSHDAGRHRVVHLRALGRALAFQGVTGDDRAVLAEARKVLSRVVGLPEASADDRIAASQEWAATAMHLDDPADAERAYLHAVDNLVEGAGPVLAWADREHHIRQAGNLPSDAAAAAIAAGHPESAVALLEQSRGMLLAEALHTRLDLGTLEANSPELAEEFRSVSRELSDIDLPQPTADGGPAPTWAADRRLELGRAWRRICRRVREVPGFEEFLLPPALTAVGDATGGGTVVIVNVSAWRCDALLVTGDLVEPVPLPDLSVENCATRAGRYLIAVQDYQEAVRLLVRARQEACEGAGAVAHQRHHAAKIAVLAARSAVENTLTDTLAWLWDTVAEPVVAHLRFGRGSRHRLWWCPTGPLALLPLHAAGHPGDPDRSLLDRAVSSYAPTLRALVTAHRAREAAPDPKMLVIAMPNGSGQPPLPDTARERDHLRSLFPPPLSTVLSDDDATRDMVLDLLASHRWIHFSCHGEEIVGAPAQSRLLLADGPLTVARLIAARPSGEFAFLSACQTAASGVTLLNETITLAATLHYAGYRHVIGTLWSVLDSVTADLSAAIYGELTASGRFRPASAAQALHSAVLRLRAQYSDRPSVWAPYVHIGI
ncbi:CHAT domain-containing protein [Streptomyces cacaoi]|uniref:CHAT domain-containing protein n=1 Tax=Streptomyces cacaoi TaxID=1898 RepID=UPI0037496C6B